MFFLFFSNHSACPANSASDGIEECVCNDGFIMNDAGDTCLGRSHSIRTNNAYIVLRVGTRVMSSSQIDTRPHTV